ncbi:hypothetical protein Tco_1219916 [Tanacetum coccineum]
MEVMGSTRDSGFPQEGQIENPWKGAKLKSKQTLGTAILQLTEKVKKLENKLRKKRKSKEAKDAEGQDQEVSFETDQGDTFATPEKSKGSGEAQEEQISPSTLEAAQILSKVASEGFRDHKHSLVARFKKETNVQKQTPSPNILLFEEPDSVKLILLGLILLNLILIVHLQLKLILVKLILLRLILVKQKGFKGEKEKSQ